MRFCSVRVRSLDVDLEMNFLWALIASTRTDASVILTPGTGDSIGTSGAVDAALELILAHYNIPPFVCTIIP